MVLSFEIPISEYEKLKEDIIKAQALRETEYQEKIKLQQNIEETKAHYETKINAFLSEHKRARRYFK